MDGLRGLQDVVDACLERRDQHLSGATWRSAPRVQGL